MSTDEAARAGSSTHRRDALSIIGRVVMLAVVLGAPQVQAKSDTFAVELRMISGTPAKSAAKQVVDPRLAAFSKDLKALPFGEIKLLDVHKTSIREGERISVELPQNKGRAGQRSNPRFLQVAAHGQQTGGKLRFQLSIDALQFDTLVAVPNGGTIVVAMPKSQGPAMLVAFTARRH